VVGGDRPPEVRLQVVDEGRLELRVPEVLASNPPYSASRVPNTSSKYG